MKVWVKGLKDARTEEEKTKCFEDALRTFKRVVNRDGVLKECKKREYYVKPGVAKRLRHAEIVKEINKKEKKIREKREVKRY